MISSVLRVMTGRSPFRRSIAPWHGAGADIYAHLSTGTRLELGLEPAAPTKILPTLPPELLAVIIQWTVAMLPARESSRGERSGISFLRELALSKTWASLALREMIRYVDSALWTALMMAGIRFSRKPRTSRDSSRHSRLATLPTAWRVCPSRLDIGCDGSSVSCSCSARTSRHFIWMRRPPQASRSTTDFSSRPVPVRAHCGVPAAADEIQACGSCR